MLGLAGLLVVVLAIMQTPLLASIRASVWSIAVHTTGRLAGVGQMSIDNDALQQMESLKADNIRLHSELADYRVLKEQLKSPSVDSMRPIKATLLGRPLDAFRTEMVLNKGTRDGAVQGAPVVINGSVLVGFISSAREDTSTLRLLLGPETSIPAGVATEEAPDGLLRGRQYTSLFLEMIPRDEALEVGNEVITRNDNLTPQGLVVGKIEEVFKTDNDAYQEASLSLPYNPDDLRAVSILVKK